jgi:hypothetical protein
MTEVEQKDGYEVYVCPGCGDELSVYDIEPFSVSDVGAPRREEGDLAGNYFCSECDLDFKPLAVVSLQDVREKLEAIAQDLDDRGEAAIDLTEEGQLYGEAAVIREHAVVAFPESSTEAGSE